MPGSKYTIEIVVTGGAQGALQNVQSAMRSTHNVAMTLKGGLHEAGEALEGLHKIAEFFALEKVIEQFDSLSEHMQEFTKKMFEKGGELIKDFHHTASEFEDIQSSLQFSFGENWRSMYDKTFHESQHLAFTFKQSADLVANLGKIGVNAFGGMGEEIKKFKAKTGESIGAMDVLQDTLAGTGLSMGEAGRLMRGVHEALVGNFREFKMGLAMPPKLIEEMRGKIHAAGGDMQKAFDGIIEALAKFYGGATKLRELNLSFQIQQLTDKWELFKGAIAGPGLRTVTEGLKAFVDSIQRLLDDKDAMKSLAETFGLIQKSIAWVFRAAGAMVDFTREILHAAPWLPQVALGLVVLGGSFALVATAAIGTALSIVSVGVALGVLISQIGLTGIAIALSLLPFLPILTATFVALTGAVVLFTAALGLMVYGGLQILIQSGESAYSIFDKLRVLFGAFNELITSYNGTSSEMSLETADKLKSMGLLEFVLDTMDVFNRLATAWRSFLDVINNVGDYIRPTLIPMLEDLKTLFLDILETFGLYQPVTDANGHSVHEWAKAGESLAMQLMHATKWVITFFDKIIKLADTPENLKAVKDWFANFIEDVKTVFVWLDKIAHLMHTVGKVFGFFNHDLGTGEGTNKEFFKANPNWYNMSPEELEKARANFHGAGIIDQAISAANAANNQGDSDFLAGIRHEHLPPAPGGVPYGIDTMYSSAYGGGSSPLTNPEMPPGQISSGYVDPNAPNSSQLEYVKQMADGTYKTFKAVQDLTAAINNQKTVVSVDGHELMSAMRSAEVPVGGGV